MELPEAEERWKRPAVARRAETGEAQGCFKRGKAGEGQRISKREAIEVWDGRKV